MQSSGDVVLDEVMLFEEPRIEGKLKWIERKAGKGHGTTRALHQLRPVCLKRKM